MHPISVEMYSENATSGNFLQNWFDQFRKTVKILSVYVIFMIVYSYKTVDILVPILVKSL